MERHDDNALIIYTDGSCLQRPRRGGFAFRLIWIGDDGEDVIDDYGPPGRLGATNNQMELMACVEALRLVSGRRSPVPRGAYEKVVLYTDSQYVHDHVYAAEVTWPQSRWMTREGEPVINPDLWKDLVKYKQACGRVDFRKVKAHKTNPHNKAVDKLAKQSARTATEDMPGQPIVRRRKSPNRTAPRCVAMRGQVEVVRIIEARDVPGEPHHVYRYEVVNNKSQDFELVDHVFARDDEINLRPHHSYEVRFAEPGIGRWITEVIREVPTR